MSFSSEIKENLSKISNLKNKEEVKYELIGYLISSNTVYNKNKIMYTTSNEYNINRFSKLLLNINIMDFKIELKGKKYIITLPRIKNIEEIEYIANDIQLTKLEISENLKKSLIRGTFLGSGSINNPENKYHMEIILSTLKNAKMIQQILLEQGIETKELERKNGTSLYIKEGEQISRYFAFIGANKAVLKFEEIRVIRDMKNNINRKVNCETANITKTVNAAVKQIEAIKLLKKQNKFESLPENLKEIANLREKNPDATLIELGQMLEIPIGKSGVNHRLNSIIQISKNS